MLGEVLTATVTPFDSDGSVDLDGYQELRAFLVDNGSDGVVVNGTTGEASTLSEDERVAPIRAALEAIGDRGNRGRRDGHQFHRALDRAERAGAGGRRARRAGRDAVLQQAAAARDRRAF